MDKLWAHSLANYWIICINGSGFNTYPENMNMMVHATARCLEDYGYPDEAKRVRDEWRKKQGLYYGRYISEHQDVIDEDDAEESRVVPAEEFFTEEEIEGFHKRFNEWLERMSDTLNISTDRYRKRVEERRKELMRNKT